MSKFGGKTIVSSEIFIVCVLALALLLTRNHHFNNSLQLLDASWSVFFLAGFYLSARRIFLLLLLLAVVSDFLSFLSGADRFAFSPAYAFLPLTYYSLWRGGVLMAQRMAQTKGLLPLWRAMEMLLFWLATATVAFFISNSSFFLLSGHFDSLLISDYVARVSQYYLPFLSASWIYLFPALALHQLYLWCRREGVTGRAAQLP